MKRYQKYSKDVMDIREFIEKIDRTAKMLNEGFGGEVPEEEMASQEEVMAGPEDKEEVAASEVEMAPEQNDEMAGMQYVDQIRKAAIEGIEAFVDNVDSPSYDFFKKVFMMADKVLSQDEDKE